MMSEEKKQINIPFIGQSFESHAEMEKFMDSYSRDYYNSEVEKLTKKSACSDENVTLKYTHLRYVCARSGYILKNDSEKKRKFHNKNRFECPYVLVIERVDDLLVIKTSSATGRITSCIEHNADCKKASKKSPKVSKKKQKKTIRVSDISRNLSIQHPVTFTEINKRGFADFDGNPISPDVVYNEIDNNEGTFAYICYNFYFCS